MQTGTMCLLWMHSTSIWLVVDVVQGHHYIYMANNPFVQAESDYFLALKPFAA